MNLLSRVFGRPPGGMSCAQIEMVLQEYLDKELDAAEVPKVLAHLEKCRDCGLEAELYTRIKGSLESHREAPTADSMARIRAMANELASHGPADDS